MNSATQDSPMTPQRYSGRLAVVVHKDSPNAYQSGFVLEGVPGQGILSLTGPLGITLGKLQWTPAEAVLEGMGKRKSYASIEALTTERTGAALPMDALFAWLAGKPYPQEGWQVDQSQLAQGRLTAQRQSPQPVVDLTVLLD